MPGRRPWPLHRLSGLTFPTEVHHAKRGRPKTGALPDQTVIRLSATLEEKADEIVPRIKRLGVFVLATNETPEALSAADMLSMYRKQGTSVERGFRFPKILFSLPKTSSSKLPAESWLSP